MFYNFNIAGIVTNEIFKKYVRDKRIFALFLRTKDIKKVLMKGKWRENKKICATPYYSPLFLRTVNKKQFLVDGAGIKCVVKEPPV
jgi:hypothetical protein